MPESRLANAGVSCPLCGLPVVVHRTLLGTGRVLREWGCSCGAGGDGLETDDEVEDYIQQWKEARARRFDTEADDTFWNGGQQLWEKRR